MYEFFEWYTARYSKSYSKETYKFDILKTQCIINNVIFNTAQDLLWITDKEDLREREKMYKKIFKSMKWFNMLYLNYSPKYPLS